MTMRILQFRGEWREYQARVLDELDSHLDDSHLHIVAAPGSGKTILGLEVMRRLGAPSLILAPTITIRNQWIDRLTSLFLEGPQDIGDWITKDIRNPKTLTFITYQALHAVFTGEDIEDEDLLEPEEEDEEKTETIEKPEIAAVIDRLNDLEVQTVILDEAHHLRKEWWNALTALKEGLIKPTVLSLTATPPYDVEYAEWLKYEELCGPIDAEVTVPELVKRGDLCPHQDYVYFGLPTKNEAKKLRQFKSDVRSFLAELEDNELFLEAISSHPWIKHTESHVEEILSEPAFFSSLIIYRNSLGMSPSKHVLNILGVREKDIQSINAEWLETLLTGVLYTREEDFAEHEETLSILRRRLKRIGVIERRKVVIDNTKEIKKLLASSLSKLDSIVDITRQEARHLQNDLRLVVLADYIRMSELPSGREDNRPIDKIGVVPIFEYLRLAQIQGLKLGVLTGSIVVIPKDAQSALEKLSSEMGINRGHIQFFPLAHDENYLRVEIRGESRQGIVQLITEIFGEGHITALVGTQALLGEGWDAPSVNTLILASHVGSFMLSNQMRGRAIRIDPRAPNKVANIWHLVSVDIETVLEKLEKKLTGQTKRRQYFDPFDEIKQDLGNDLRMLRRRFRAFEGLSHDEPIVIENGFKRLGLSKAKWDEEGVKQTSQKMLARAIDRESLPDLWEQALEGKSPKPGMREKVESNHVPNSFAFADTIKYLALEALLGGFVWGTSVLQGSDRDSNALLLLGLSLVIAMVYAAPKLLKALYLLIRNGSIEGSMKQVGWAVIKTLQYMELIKTNPRNLKIETASDKMGVAYCRIDGATNIEKRHFLEAMKEVLGPIENPRYLLVRRSHLGNISRIDYHSVPRAVGKSKKHASFFHKKWNRYVGEAELAYTRTVEGRSTLLKARTRALSSAFVKKADRISVWE